jgi:hypothetical protein
MSSSFKTALIAAVVSAVVSAGAAVATTQAFVLGTNNRVNAPSSVTNVQDNGTTANPVNAPLLTLENKSTTANATALSLLAAPNHPALKVNTQTKVPNLNADQLDGKDSAYFLAKTGRAVDADNLDGLDSTQLSPAEGAFRTADLPLTISVQPTLTASITTAHLSLLVVSAAVGVVNTQTNAGGVQCFVTIDGAGTNESFTTYTDALRTTLPVVWVQAVEAGPHTVELGCKGASYLYVDMGMMSLTAHVLAD